MTTTSIANHLAIDCTVDGESSPEPGSVRLEGGRLVVERFSTAKAPVVALFQAEKDASSYPFLLESVLEVGAIAMARAGSQVDLGHVASEVERLAQAVGHSVESFSRLLSAEANAQIKALSSKVEEVLGAEGALVRMLDPTDPKGAAAKLTKALAETTEASRRQLVRLLDPSCAEGPMAAFAAELRALSRSVGGLAIQVAAISAAEKATAAEAAKGTRKGGVYEDQVVEAIGEIARISGDVAEAVGSRAALDGSKKGDVKVHVSPNVAGGRVSLVFEAKNRRLGLEALKRELSQARAARGAAVAVAVFASEELMPKGTAPLCEVDPFSFAVVYDPSLGDAEALRLAYRLARIVAVAWLRKQTQASGLDPRALGADLSEATRLLAEIATVKARIAQTKNAVTKGLGDCERSLGDSLSRLSEVLSRMEGRLRAPRQHPTA